MTREMRKYLLMQKIKNQSLEEWRAERKKVAIGLRHSVMLIQVLSIILMAGIVVAALVR